MTALSRFSAPDSALGYLYQIRVALLWALRRIKQGREFLVSLETLDDVTFDSMDGRPEDVLQLKHHRTRPASLTDSCPDLWKSLRVWLEGCTGGQIPPTAALHLITTATAPDGSAASFLRVQSRDVDSAMIRLEAAAHSSSNSTNTPAYAMFLGMQMLERHRLLGQVVVLDSSPSIIDLDDELLQEVYYASERRHHQAFLARLEGWWFRRTLKQLSSHSANDRIAADEIDWKMQDLREQFGRDSLPIDDDLLELGIDEAAQAAHADAVFVCQLMMIKAERRRVAAAIRDYVRAYEQRSRWLRDELLYVGDLDKYELRLVEEWELPFARLTECVGESAAEEPKIRAAREVLTWAESCEVPIRREVREPFVTRGSLHMLADEQRIGWHPEFRSRLAALLGVRERVA